MKNSKYFKAKNIILCICLLIVFGSLTFNIYDLIRKNYTINNIKGSAVLYIKNKYGFEVETTDVVYNKYDNIIFKMNAGGKDFYTEYYKRDNGSIYYGDDFQIDEIKNIICDELNKKMPNCEVRNFVVSKRANGSLMFYDFIDTYFDNKNSDAFFTECGIKIQIDYCAEKVDAVNQTQILETLKKWSIESELTSFDTVDHFKEFVSATSKVSASVWDVAYAKYAPYIIDKINIENGKVVNKTYDIKSCDEFDYYYLYGIVDDDLVKSPVIKEAEGGIEKIGNYFAKSEEDRFVNNPITKAYKFSGKSGFLFIYYPLEKLNDISVEKIGAVWVNYEGGEKNHGISRACLCGNSIVIEIPYYAKEFMLIDMSTLN